MNYAFDSLLRITITISATIRMLMFVAIMVCTPVVFRNFFCRGHASLPPS